MLEKNFDPHSFEKDISFDMEASARNPNAEPFAIVLPPPNVTGVLHIGHALSYTLQDILVRYKRLKGYDALFLPGLDHAGIVTQLLVEKQLCEKGVKKDSLTREKLLEEIWNWKESSGCEILEQMKILGISCDFSKLRFTMDEGCTKGVTKLFVQLFNDGLIFKGKRIGNWDPMICSAISDLEVIEKEVDGNLWYIKYMIEDSSEFITVATSRPETIFGDVAVAVHPEDKKYQHLIGKKVLVPLINKPIPIIRDHYADPTKGSGAVKITPAHDFNDFEVGLRHNLPIIDIFNDKAELNNNAPETFRGMGRFEARKSVADLLTEKNLIVKVESIEQMLPFGDRSGTVLEPRITNQWFVDAEKLAIPAIKAVKSGKIKLVPKHWENFYYEWMENIKPWCISRQIWWGHRIPAWYGPDGKVFVAETYEGALESAKEVYKESNVELIQDDDVLDTWFSSAMWPFLTMGWPNKTSDLQKYYPNAALVTGFDIIFFWVARMIMFGIYTMDEIPFENVYIHGLVRDAKGKKMSKSKGNIIDPLELCKKYGADAVRYTLASMASPGRDLRIADKIIEPSRNFLTKFWNIVRFSQMNGCIYNREFDPNTASNPISKWIIHTVKKLVGNVENDIESYRFDDAAKHIYHCIWDDFCDWYIEFIKPLLQQKSLKENTVSESAAADYALTKEIKDTTAWAIVQFTRVLYPVAPFISKKLSSEMGVEVAIWPDITSIDIDFTESIEQVAFMKDMITAIRTTKQCINVAASEKLNARLETSHLHIRDLALAQSVVIEKMAAVTLVENTSQNCIPIVINGGIIHLEFGGNIDIHKEKKRLSAEISKLEILKKDAINRLNNDDFLKKASEDIVIEHRERVVNLNDKIQQIEYVIKNLTIV